MEECGGASHLFTFVTGPDRCGFTLVAVRSPEGQADAREGGGEKKGGRKKN